MAGRTHEVRSEAAAVVPPAPVLRRRAAVRDAPPGPAPAIVSDVLRSPGQPLDRSTREAMEPRLGPHLAGVPARSVSSATTDRPTVGSVHDPAEHEADAVARRIDTTPAGPVGPRADLADVRVHTDARAAASARAVDAEAYTVGRHVVFGAGAYAPHTARGRALLAHELTHAVQAGGGPEPVVRRRVEMRDVGRGEQSGFARLPELVDRLNAISPALVFALTGSDLTYTQRAGTTPNEFERRMMALVDQATVLPLRLTNRHGLLGDPAAGFHTQVDADAFRSGYVDIDDLLASTDLGLQSLLVHFLTERAATAGYARRIGTALSVAEFQVGHARGIEAERDVLRDFFGDPTIRIVADSVSPSIRRVFRNDRGDTIRRRITRGRGAEAGVHASSIEVATKDGRRLTADEYREERETERQRARERLGGATEHRAGGRSVPSP
jgi:hypothetical protein